MQQYDEWLIDFQVQHGRKPSDKEVAEAAKTGFALSSGLSRQKNSKFRQVLSKVGLVISSLAGFSFWKFCS